MMWNSSPSIVVPVAGYSVQPLGVYAIDQNIESQVIFVEHHFVVGFCQDYVLCYERHQEITLVDMCRLILYDI